MVMAGRPNVRVCRTREPGRRPWVGERTTAGDIDMWSGGLPPWLGIVIDCSALSNGCAMAHLAGATYWVIIGVMWPQMAAGRSEVAG